MQATVIKKISDGQVCWCHMYIKLMSTEWGFTHKHTTVNEKCKGRQRNMPKLNNGVYIHDDNIKTEHQ